MAELGTELPWESTSGEFCYLSNCGISAPWANMGGKRPIGELAGNWRVTAVWGQKRSLQNVSGALSWPPFFFSSANLKSLI
jgi:hypothetical protein